ncbi:hypothetical protein VNO78_26932 [Psophocarpus tetragonolobus]|uniref:Uncharacterized protein n=1 Tax=Psophocarpus tetragonolobus TaxID=3891 RepID=A0AAN9RZX3_PSOTE
MRQHSPPLLQHDAMSSFTDMRIELEKKQKKQVKRLMEAIEIKMMKKLKVKEEEISKLKKLNWDKNGEGTSGMKEDVESERRHRHRQRQRQLCAERSAYIPFATDSPQLPLHSDHPTMHLNTT